MLWKNNGMNELFAKENLLIKFLKKKKLNILIIIVYILHNFKIIKDKERKINKTKHIYKFLI